MLVLCFPAKASVSVSLKKKKKKRIRCLIILHLASGKKKRKFPPDLSIFLNSNQLTPNMFVRVQLLNTYTIWFDTIYCLQHYFNLFPRDSKNRSTLESGVSCQLFLFLETTQCNSFKPATEIAENCDTINPIYHERLQKISIPLDCYRVLCAQLVLKWGMRNPVEGEDSYRSFHHS